MSRFKIMAAVYLLLKKDEQILLLRRQNTGYEDGNYSVPAGHVEENESILNAMIREAKEEVGIDISAENLSLAHVISRNSPQNIESRVDFFFLCEKWQGKIKNCEPEKCDELGWYSIENLPENIINYVVFALKNSISSHNQIYSEFNW